MELEKIRRNKLIQSFTPREVNEEYENDQKGRQTATTHHHADFEIEETPRSKSSPVPVHPTVKTEPPAKDTSKSIRTPQYNDSDEETSPQRQQPQRQNSSVRISLVESILTSPHDTPATAFSPEKEEEGGFFVVEYESD